MSLIHKQLLILAIISISGLLTSFSATAQDSEWTPVTGAETLSTFMSGRTMDRDLIGGGSVPV